MKLQTYLLAFGIVTSATALETIFVARVMGQQNPSQNFAIASQPLSSALLEFAELSGLQFLFDARLAEGKTAPELIGPLSTNDALTNLLEGSGLTYRRVSGSTIAVEAIDAGAVDVALPPIVVEGELLQRTRQDSQTSVAVITGDDLEARSDPDLFAVIERTPGVSGARDNIAIRGITQEGFGSGLGNSRLISQTVDGATVSNFDFLTGNGPFSTWDLAQIEILRGPQSTQTGRNALAGAIILRSKDPTDEVETKLRLEGGNFSTVGGAFAVNAPVEGTGLAVRLSADKRRTDGFIDNPTIGTGDFGKSESTTLRGAVKFEPTDEFSGILKYTYNENEIGAQTVDDSLFPPSRVNASNDPIKEDSEFNSVNLRMGYNLSDQLTLESETTYFWNEFRQDFDVDGTAAPGQTGLRLRDFDNFEQELRLGYDSEWLRGTFGLFYTEFERDAKTDVNTPAAFFVPTAPPDAFVTFGSKTIDNVENYAVFGEVETEVLPSMTLVTGARYDREKFDSDSETVFTSDDPDVAPFLPPANPGTILNSDFDAFLPKIGLVYDVTEDASIGFTVQRGYRSGGASIRGATGELVEFGPEKTWNFELSTRSQWFDDRLTANANIFFTRWTDQQVNVEGEIPVIDRFTDNAGKSRLYGGEIELVAQATDNLDVFASAAYVETELVEFTTNGNVLDGNEFPGAPKFTSAAGGTYYFENGFFLSADASYTGSAFSDAANTDALKSDSRFLVNARTGYETESWNVTVYTRNLFDKDYATSRFNTGSGIGAQPGESLVFGLIAQMRF
ncbi:MAG: TonB-dependent receptor [Pseudomonadota bacterium]